MSYDNSDRDDDLIDQYVGLEMAREHDAPESWPVEAMRTIVSMEPDRAWRILKEIIRKAPDELLPRIAVRELEEFVKLHGSEFVSEIEAQAKTDPGFRYALGEVWISKGRLPRDIENRLIAASNGVLTVLDPDEKDE